MDEATTRDDVRNALLKYLDTDSIWYSLSFLYHSYTLAQPTVD